MEEQILHYYLKKFKIIILIIFISIFLYSTYVIFKKENIHNNIITIQKGASIKSVLSDIFIDKNHLELIIFKIYYRLKLIFKNDGIHYGDFYINEKINFIELLNILTKPSNVLKKITIVEGWSNYDLENELSKHFKNYKTIKFIFSLI